MDTGEIRASDKERQAVIDRLSSACGDGQLTLDEFSERSGEVWAAVTRGQLDEITATSACRCPRRDRPPSLRPAPRPNRSHAGAGGSSRSWAANISAVVGGPIATSAAFALMGGVHIDFRDATLESDEIDITAWSVMGDVHVTVPDGIPVDFSGFMLIGRGATLVSCRAAPGGTEDPASVAMGCGLDRRAQQATRQENDDEADGGARPPKWAKHIRQLQNLEQNLENQRQNRARTRHVGYRTGCPHRLRRHRRHPSSSGARDRRVHRHRRLDAPRRFAGRPAVAGPVAGPLCDDARRGRTARWHRGEDPRRRPPAHVHQPPAGGAVRRVVPDRARQGRAEDPGFALEARVGVHAGEVERRGRTLSGAT